ncbi:MAG: pyruvate formate lyase family protein, partial [Promethearchaeota archaeon]
DRQFSEIDWYNAPEIYFYLGNKSRGIFSSSLSLMAETVELPKDFWTKSLPERRIIFFEKVMLDKIPQEIIGPELLAGGRFNTQLSKCLNEKEQKLFDKLNLTARHQVFRYHNHGFGNVGAIAGHLIPDYENIIKNGFKSVYNKAKQRYEQLSQKEKNGSLGDELRAIIQAAEIPRKLAKKYAEECRRIANESNDETRKQELAQMANNLEIVPWEPAQTFWQAVQSLWFIHMLVMAEESYPGPGLSFGRTDQHLWDLYRKDVIDEGNISKDFAKEILGSFWFHCNTAYDAQMRIGNTGITAAFGQLMTLSGCGSSGEDLTNELTYTILEVIDEWSPILEPKPNVRLHRNSPDKLLNIIVDMITKSQGAPFLLNFDERSIAGMIREGIPKEDAWDYACVGCLENTMQGNDRSGTVNCNPNLAKSLLLTLNNGKSANQNQNVIMLHPKEKKPIQMGLKTGLAEDFKTWEEFWNAWVKQIKFQIKYTVETYNISEEFRANLLPTPYLSAMVKGCISQGLDVRNGGPEIRFVTIEGVGFATLVDSLLAIKKFVYDEKKFTIAELKEAMENDFKGKKEWEIMQSLLKNRAPKYGNDNDEADKLAQKVMEIWSQECFKYKTPTNFKYRPGMLSWNYWAGEDAGFTPATPDGRIGGQFLSNAISPTNGADIQGPTAVTNSVGTVLGGKDENGNYVNFLPNGASHTLTFNPSLLRNPELKDKFKAYLRGYIENGGTALQINILDTKMLKDAQINPQGYQNLLVRITGYNAYFVSIGKELQDEIIAREMHNM